LRSVLGSYMGYCITMATLTNSPTGITCFHRRVLADTKWNTYFTTRLAQDLANSIKLQAVWKSCPTRAEFANSAGGHSWDNCSQPPPHIILQATPGRQAAPSFYPGSLESLGLERGVPANDVEMRGYVASNGVDDGGISCSRPRSGYSSLREGLGTASDESL
jgi:hypothetical protein